MSSNESDKDYQEKYPQLKEYLISLENEQLQLRSTITNNQKEITQLKSDIISLKAALDIKESNIKQSKEIINSYKQNILTLEEKASNLEKENKTLNYEIIDLQNKLKGNIKISNNCNSQLNEVTFQSKLEELQTIINKLEFDKKCLQNKITDKSKKIETDLALLKLLKDVEISQKDKIIESQKCIINELKISTKEKNYQTIYKKDFESNLNLVTICLAQISALDSDILNSNEEIFKLKKLNSNLENKIAEIKIQLTHKENVIESLENMTQESIHDYNNNIHETKTNFEEMNKNLKLANLHCQKLEEEKKELLIKNEELIQKLGNYNQNIQFAQKMYLEKIDEYKKHLEVTLGKIEIYKKNLNNLKLKLSLLKNENDNLKNEITIGLDCFQNIGINMKGTPSSFNVNNPPNFNYFPNNAKNNTFFPNNQLNEYLLFHDIKESIHDYKQFLEKVDFNIQTNKDSLK